MRPLARALPALSLLALFAFGCETRIEEPIPSAKAASAPPAAVPASGDTVPARTSILPPPASPASSGDGAAPRCIKATPPTPQRTITGKVPDPACPKDPDTPPKLRTGKVTFVDAKAQTVTVEVTEKEADRQR